MEVPMNVNLRLVLKIIFITFTYLLMLKMCNMRKLFKTAMLVGGLITLTSLPFGLNATTYYRTLDYCGQYTNYPGCFVWVLKCDFDGGTICGVSDQIPCAEVCEPIIAP